MTTQKRLEYRGCLIDSWTWKWDIRERSSDETRDHAVAWICIRASHEISLPSNEDWSDNRTTRKHCWFTCKDRNSAENLQRLLEKHPNVHEARLFESEFLDVKLTGVPHHLPGSKLIAFLNKRNGEVICTKRLKDRRGYYEGRRIYRMRTAELLQHKGGFILASLPGAFFVKSTAIWSMIVLFE